MVKRKSTRHYSFLPSDHDTANDTFDHSRSASQQTNDAGSCPHPTSSKDLVSPPAKRKRSLPHLSSPLTPLGSSSSSPSGPPARREQPRVSLARLPLDILSRVGHFLLPAPIPLTDKNGNASAASQWVDCGKDLVAFTSSSRSLWASSRDFIGRSFGCDNRTNGGGYFSSTLVQRRLDCIVSDEDYASKHAAAAREKASEGGKSTSSSAVSKQWRAHDLWEYVPASRVRHLYIAVSGDEEVFYKLAKRAPLGQVVAEKLKELPNLESVAFVWRTELEVIEKTPYSLVKLPADILVALAAHPTLRDLFLCGIKFSRHFCDESLDFPSDDSVRFQPSFTTLTINACHDSALECITMAPSVKEVRAWRDYCKVPRISNEYYWNKDTWRSIERLDMSGFSGQQGLTLIQHWQQQLVSLRSLTPPVEIPLHTLRLSEPYPLPTLRDDILPAFANLPHLKSLHLIVWNERHFGASFLQKIYEALPDLEELSVGLEGEALQWWQGSLTDYADVLRRFKNLRTFTWNYSPYADLDYTETRKHVLPMLDRSLLLHANLPDSFTTIKWFNEDIELRRVRSTFSNSSKWVWSNNAIFDRPLPDWAVEALKPKEEAKPRRTLVLSTSSSESEDECLTTSSFAQQDDDASEEEDEAPKKKVDRKGKGKALPSASASASASANDLSSLSSLAHPSAALAASTSLHAATLALLDNLAADIQEDRDEAALLAVVPPRSDSSMAPHLRRKATRKSVGELLEEAKREEGGRGKGKGKAVEVDEEEEEEDGPGEGGKGAAGDDSGWWEMEAADL